MEAEATKGQTMSTPSDQAKRAAEEVDIISHKFAGLCGYRSMLTDAIQSAIDSARADESSNLCSAHQTPDPLNCDTCNRVKWLTDANLERMTTIDSLTEQLAQCRAELDTIELGEARSELRVVQDQLHRMLEKTKSAEARITGFQSKVDAALNAAKEEGEG